MVLPNCFLSYKRKSDVYTMKEPDTMPTIRQGQRKGLELAVHDNFKQSNCCKFFNFPQNLTKNLLKIDGVRVAPPFRNKAPEH